MIGNWAPAVQAAASADLAVATAWRIGANDGLTRFVLDLNRAVKFDAHATDTRHIAIDIDPVALRVANPGRLSGGLIGGVRVVAPAATRRIWLDLAAPGQIQRAYLILPRDGFGHRLVIDVAPGSSAPARGEEPPAAKPAAEHGRSARNEGRNAGRSEGKSQGKTTPARTIEARAAEERPAPARTAAGKLPPPVAAPPAPVQPAPVQSALLPPVRSAALPGERQPNARIQAAVDANPMLTPPPPILASAVQPATVPGAPSASSAPFTPPAGLIQGPLEPSVLKQPARISGIGPGEPPNSGGPNLLTSAASAAPITGEPIRMAGARLTPSPDPTPRPGLTPASVVVPILPPTRAPPKPQLRVIALDAGHGGNDPGATSLTGVHEKAITLAMAKAVARHLNATGRYKVFLTREDDRFIPLRDRVALARAAGAELFISMHADTISNKQVNGLSVYTLSETASDAESQALATKENKADILAGVNFRAESPEVISILVDLAQRETKNRSAQFATGLLDELRPDVRLLPNKAHRFAGFVVLTAPDVPSVLVEIGYLSNPQDEHDLLDSGYRDRLADGIRRAADHFFALGTPVARR